MHRFIRLGAVLALGLGLLVAPTTLAPASAHGGKIDIEVGTDGTGGISAALVWAGDGHPVEESAVVVVQAVSDAGQEVGPITLDSASEGVGWYRSEPAVLDEGHWTLTARVKEPAKAKVVTEIDVAAPPSAEPSDPAPSDSAPSEAGPAATEDTEITAEAGGNGSATAATSSSGGLPRWTGWLLGVLVAAGAVTAVVLRRRTRTTKTR